MKYKIVQPIMSKSAPECWDTAIVIAEFNSSAEAFTEIELEKKESKVFLDSKMPAEMGM